MSVATKLVPESLSMAFDSAGLSFKALAVTDLNIEAGRFVSLIGPSRRGKSTIFNIVAVRAPCSTPSARTTAASSPRKAASTAARRATPSTSAICTPNTPTC